MSFAILRVAVFCSLLLTTLAVQAEDPFALGVRNTEHRTPEEEQKLFKLPPGFEMQLVAAEPQIQKPLNMAFDARGRLWVTDTIEYPYAAPPDRPGRDSIKIIDFDYQTGHATKITTFADGLNIPIGLLPYKNGVIAHSIPNIWYFEDTDGDDKCDKRTVLYGPFDYSRDTHGMENAFRRGFDGWIYGCHGFNNDSHVKGADGHEVHLNSGNTFRFRPDGSRIEHFSHGQVNPFGMCFDNLFNIFTADCHSKPITQILRGGYYESFGKPDDGLGKVPAMMDHLHGSTAICGLVWVDGAMFPQEYQGNLLSGNVMTSRINRNSLVYHGSTIKCKEEPDFLATEDPWFRPVDLQIGPDGALYIADFYNRIIGHYEVPLPHPGRDRTSGRIWRVVYRGERDQGPGTGGDKADGRTQKADGEDRGEGDRGTGNREKTKPAVRQRDLTTASVEELIAELDNPTLTQRLLAEDELVNRVGEDALPKLVVAFKTASEQQATHLQWVVYRLDEKALSDLYGHDGLDVIQRNFDHKFWTHYYKVRAESETQRKTKPDFALGDIACVGGEAFATRAAADCLGQNTNKAKAAIFIQMLVGRLQAIPKEDNHLSYVIRRAIRNNLAILDDLGRLTKLDEEETKEVAQISLAVQSSGAAGFLVSYLESTNEPQDQQLRYLTHAARYAEGDGVTKLADLIRTRWTEDLDLQLKALLALQQGLAERGQSSESLVTWAEELGGKLLDQTDANVVAWENFAVPGANDAENPWVFQQRVSADGNKDALFYSSLVKGEQKTGILRSQPFELPEKLSFWCAGHIGPPPTVLDLNYIRLRSAKTNEVLAESRPPRNDTAQRSEWDLAKFKGQRGYVEIVDADTGSAYAWLAVGRFSVSGLNPNEAANRQQLVAKLATELKLKSLQPRLAMLFTSGLLDAPTRGAIGSALVSLTPNARAAALVRIVSEPGSEIAARQDLTKAIVSLESEDLDKALKAALKQVPARTQTAVAETLASDVNGVTELLQLVELGSISSNVLRSPIVQQKVAGLKHEALQKQCDELTAKLPPASEAADELIRQRRATIEKAKPNIARGVELFTKNCANCHQIGGKGQVVGPQLDGVGQRGVDRIVEDVLDPNRNVDVAFRTVTLELTDGRIVSGLVRREEGEQLVVVDNQGKERRLAKSDVEERHQTSISLMPANVAEIISPDDFPHLIGYLLEQKAKREGE